MWRSWLKGGLRLRSNQGRTDLAMFGGRSQIPANRFAWVRNTLYGFCTNGLFSAVPSVLGVPHNQRVADIITLA